MTNKLPLPNNRFRSSLMKSKLLASKLHATPGRPSGQAFVRVLTTTPAVHPELTTGFRNFNAVHGTVAQCARLLKLKSVFSGGVFLDWNLKTDRIESGWQWKSLLGYADDELADTLSAWRGRVRVADLGRLESAIAAHAHSQSAFFQVECRLRTQAGGWKWLRLKGMVASRDANTEPTRIFLMQQDITEFKHTEALASQAQASAEASSPAQISHEIHFPKDGVLGMTERAFDSAAQHSLKTGPATEGVPHQDADDSLIAGIVNFKNRLETKSGHYYMEQLNLLRAWLNTHIARSDKSRSPFCAARTIKK